MCDVRLLVRYRVHAHGCAGADEDQSDRLDGRSRGDGSREEGHGCVHHWRVQGEDT